MDGTPSANFDTFPAAIMTVFQVGAGLPGDTTKGTWGHLLTPPWLGGVLCTKQVPLYQLLGITCFLPLLHNKVAGKRWKLFHLCYRR